ncbi:MAG: histidinol-phosphate transaminase [Deltaproteobacteria bacterium]|nr:histidinol-phosphate transaminase [Deltaproteobacteria bacterium]
MGNTLELIKTEIRDLLPYKIDETCCPIKLDANENPYPLPDELREKVNKALSEVLLNRYPDPDARELKGLISHWLSVPEEFLMLGNGSDELIQAILIATSWGSPTVVVPSPTFSMYKITGLAVGHRVLEIPLDKSFDIDPAAVIDACGRERAKVVFLSTPNNPTGNRFSDDKVLEVVKGSHALVVVDEAYGDFSGKTLVPYLKENMNLIILKTLSKIGMAGLRLGIMAANPDLINELDKVRLPYNINSLSQAVAAVLLNNMDAINGQIDAIIPERERVYRALRDLDGVTPYPSEANFILFKVRDADDLHKRLVEKGILIRNLNRPGRLENCMRVTVGTPEENGALLGAMAKLLINA